MCASNLPADLWHTVRSTCLRCEQEEEIGNDRPEQPAESHMLSASFLEAVGVVQGSKAQRFMLGSVETEPRRPCILHRYRDCHSNYHSHVRRTMNKRYTLRGFPNSQPMLTIPTPTRRMPHGPCQQKSNLTNRDRPNEPALKPAYVLTSVHVCAAD